VAVIVSPGQRGAVAVVHGGGVNAVLVLAAQAWSGPLSPLIVRTATPPPPSSSATGVLSWSCVHNPLKLVPTRCKALQIPEIPLECSSIAGMQGAARQTLILLCAVSNYDGTHSGTNPKPANHRSRE
jgi:hypothetical protein